MKTFYELWGLGTTYEEIYSSLKALLPQVWNEKYTQSFSVDESYQRKRTEEGQHNIINSFSYLNLEGIVKMRNPELQLTILEN